MRKSNLLFFWKIILNLHCWFWYSWFLFCVHVGQISRIMKQKCTIAPRCVRFTPSGKNVSHQGLHRGVLIRTFVYDSSLSVWCTLTRFLKFKNFSTLKVKHFSFANCQTFPLNYIYIAYVIYALLIYVRTWICALWNIVERYFRISPFFVPVSDCTKHSTGCSYTHKKTGKIWRNVWEAFHLLFTRILLEHSVFRRYTLISTKLCRSDLY